MDLEVDNTVSKHDSSSIKPTNTVNNSGIRVGDAVEFIGNTHYTYVNASVGDKYTSGKAKVTNISKRAAYLYHLVSCESGCSVYGLVNVVDIKSDNLTIKVGNSVRVKSGATTYDGGSLASFVFKNIFTAIKIKGDIVIIGLNGLITATAKTNDLILIWHGHSL